MPARRKSKPLNKIVNVRVSNDDWRVLRSCAETSRSLRRHLARLVRRILARTPAEPPAE